MVKYNIGVGDSSSCLRLLFTFGSHFVLCEYLFTVLPRESLPVSVVLCRRELLLTAHLKTTGDNFFNGD